MPGFDETALRARFWDLTATANAVRDRAAPLRAAYDAASAKADAELKAMRAAVREAEAGLADVENERAALARALKGKTGAGPGGDAAAVAGV